MENSGMIAIDQFALWPPGGLESGFAPWQIVTCMFLRGNIAHSFCNMLALYMFGGEIERLFGSRFFALYYFACVVSAALCHLIVTAAMGSAPAPMVGASGGIYGLLLAFGVYFPHRRGARPFPPIPPPGRGFV